jgi:hypothetical protein
MQIERISRQLEKERQACTTNLVDNSILISLHNNLTILF